MSPREINDEYSAIESRQARYQARRRSMGVCITCNKNPLVNKNHCAVCRDNARVSCKKWRDKQKEAQA